jgi:phosphohistidine phosphatase
VPESSRLCHVKLYVMRHGPAEERADSGMDADRALTAGGRERVRSVAKLLVAENEKPLRVVTSHLVRAVQTAEIVALVTKLSDGRVETRREVAPGGEALGLVRQLVADGTKRAMFVGHEPDLSELLVSLMGAAFERPFEKAMVVGLRVPADEGVARLRFVVDPKALKFDPDRRQND